MPTFSRTWWGQRFIAALEKVTNAGRLSRGRSYASTGRIIEHTFQDGVVNARVRGSINPYFGIYKEPIYTTSISVTQYSDRQWTQIVGAIAQRADLAAAARVPAQERDRGGNIVHSRFVLEPGV